MFNDIIYVSREDKLDKPYFDEKDCIHYHELYELTFDDGLTVEFCSWSCDSIYLWDVSIPKDVFDASGNDDFIAYMVAKGMHCDKQVDDGFCIWDCKGLQPNNKYYRIQFVCMPEDFD